MRRNARIALTLTAAFGAVAGILSVPAAPAPKAGEPSETSFSFNSPLTLADGDTFGPNGMFTAELFRNGRFEIDGTSGFAREKSDSYLDSAVIRSTDPLPPQYKISIVAGAINYDLANIAGLPLDPNYPEGPPNENGCYLLTIMDEPPIDHHINIWWHLHRKLVIDVDNNIWDAGAPNPIFMVYFDQLNSLMAWNGTAWGTDWTTAVHYDKALFYKTEVEKTATDYIFTVSSEDGTQIQRAVTPISTVWHGNDAYYKEYFALGDPHENYYQGDFKIKSISVRLGAPATSAASRFAQKYP